MASGINFWARFARGLPSRTTQRDRMAGTVKSGKSKPLVQLDPSWLEWVLDDFYARYSKQIWTVAGILVAAITLYLVWSVQRDRNELRAERDLGPAYVLLEQNRLSDAEQSLTELLRDAPAGLARDKAYLYLGKAYYDQAKYDQSQAAYGKVRDEGKSTALIYSGALHGLAACYMQEKDYAKAVGVLQQFLDKFMRRTGDPAVDNSPKGADLSPAVPNVLWKQALCFRALHRDDAAKAAVAKLRKLYPAAPEAQDGAKLLALTQ